MNNLLRHIVLPIRDFIYPPICFVCKGLLQGNEERVCLSCWDSFTAVYAAHPTWIELKEKFDAEGVVQDIVSRYLFEKEGKLQEVIHLLKYQGMKSLGVQLGREIGRRMRNDKHYRQANYLVPVPLHRLKRRERGYNQSEYICKGISEETGIPVETSFIVREKYTQSQTQLSLAERRANVSGAFSINPKRARDVTGKSLVLVDDVITTGSTINACAHELLNHGAASVLAASVALAQ